MGNVFRYTNLKIGTPPQNIEMDLDMLTADFAVLSTTALKGSRYEEFFSKSYGECFLMINRLQRLTNV